MIVIIIRARKFDVLIKIESSKMTLGFLYRWKSIRLFQRKNLVCLFLSTLLKPYQKYHYALWRIEEGIRDFQYIKIALGIFILGKQ